jgi:hypothetical protein
MQLLVTHCMTVAAAPAPVSEDAGLIVPDIAVIIIEYQAL